MEIPWVYLSGVDKHLRKINRSPLEGRNIVFGKVPIESPHQVRHVVFGKVPVVICVQKCLQEMCIFKIQCSLIKFLGIPSDGIFSNWLDFGNLWYIFEINLVHCLVHTSLSARYLKKKCCMKSLKNIQGFLLMAFQWTYLILVTFVVFHILILGCFRSESLYPCCWRS